MSFQLIAKLSMFPITATIWLNENGGKSYYSATIERSYKDEVGKWKNTNTFNASDLLVVAKIADMAHTEIEKRKASDREAQRSEQPQTED
jgi:hypothetical protein